MPLQSFAITQLSSLVGAYTGFPSTAQHVTRNPVSGTFYATVDAPYGVTNGYPNSFSLWRDTGSGPTKVWGSGSINTNMVCLESLSTGEVYIVYADWINGYVFVVYWAAGTTWTSSTAPTTTLQITSAGSGTKIGCTIDEVRRMLFIASDAGTIFRVSDTATLLGSQAVFTNGSDGVNYLTPHIDIDGKLYLVMCSAFSGQDYDYNTVVMCPNPGDIGGVTSNGSTSNGLWLTVPFVSPQVTPPLTVPFVAGWNGPATWINSGDDYRNRSSLLIGSTVRTGRMRVAMGTWPQGTSAFARDDLANVTVATFSSRWQSPNRSFFINANVTRPLWDSGWLPRCASAGWAVRALGDFLVVADKTNLLAFKSLDNGRTWSAFAQTAFPSLGANFAHYINICRDSYGKGDIVGMYTMIECTPSQWANGTAPVGPAYAGNNPLAAAYYFSLTLS